MPKFASATKVVHNEALGFDVRIVKGDVIPEELLEAYAKAGGSTSDHEPDESGDVIASDTRVVTDESLGFDRRVVEGQPVPPDLVDAYDAAGGKTTEVSKPARRSRASQATGSDSGSDASADE